MKEEGGVVDFYLRKRMSKSFLSRLRIWLLTIGFFCKLWDRKCSSEGRGMGGR